MKLKSNYSIKTKVLSVLLSVIIPLFVIFILLCIDFIRFYNQSLALTNQNALEVYAENIEEVLLRLDERITDMSLNNREFKNLTAARDDLDAHLYSLSILEQYRSLIGENKALCACFILSEPHALFRKMYKESNQNFLLRSNLENMLIREVEEGNVRTVQWTVMVDEDQVYLYQIRGVQETYAIFVLDANRLGKHDASEMSQKNRGEFVLLLQDQILSASSDVRDSGLQFTEGEDYYFSGRRQQYMVMQKKLEKSEMSVAYVMPYRGFFGSLEFRQRMYFSIAFLGIIIMAMWGYYRLKRILFKPMDELVNVMNSIKEGDMNEVPKVEFREKELREVKDTFEAMLKKIRELKIEAYEKELSLRQTQLDFYQIQIRPHFYVNCLKCIYALLEDGRKKDTRKSIVLLSNHLRYMLKGMSFNVPLKEELQYVRNYIELQQMSMAYPPECSIEVNHALEDFMIPSISLLSFVENAIKYGMKESQSLKIGIYVNRMMTDEGSYCNIHISDNGVGFSEDVLRNLNNSDLKPKDGRFVGVYNVRQRFQLYYGMEQVLFAFLNMNGAHIDIFIKERSDECIDR